MHLFFIKTLVCPCCCASFNALTAEIPLSQLNQKVTTLFKEIAVMMSFFLHFTYNELML